MMRSRSWLLLSIPALLAAACGDDGGSGSPDAATVDATPIDTEPGCDPATVLPTNFRPITTVSTGLINATATGGTMSGSIDATAGGISGSADNPYIYINLKTGAKVAINDIDARTSAEWDVALKRASIRLNGGDSGTGGRTLAVVQGDSLAAVTAVPGGTYRADDFADANCELVTLPAGEPLSAFGEWYNYDTTTHAVSPKTEVYVIKRPDGTHSALRFTTYYGDTAMPTRGAYYRAEWKQL